VHKQTKLLPLIAIFATTLCAADSTPPHLSLNYDHPAKTWTEALPVGNGRIGAMVFGGTEEEHLQINEATLWGGVPHDYTNPESHAHLDEVRQLIFAGKLDEAERLSSTLMGEPKLLMPYQPFCDVRLHFPGHAETTQYLRQLRLDEATAETDYQAGSVTFHREVFVSYPDQVLVVRLTASQPGSLNFSIDLDSPQPGSRVQSLGPDALQLTGQIEPRANPARSWTGSWSEPGLRFAAFLKVINEGGSVRNTEGRMQVSSANSVTVLFSNATSFRNYRDIGGDPIATATAYLQQASGRSFGELRQRHIHDFQSLFSRVQLQLGPDRSTESTDRRIAAFPQNQDPSLLALYFEFGRYLLISSSRLGGQPANLQGIWNQDMRPPWGSKWTTNINLEMNYWQADSGDLSETEQPLWNLIGDLRSTGAETARVEYHAQGWVLHHNTDLWRATAPVDGPWGIWPTGAAWLSNQMWDHYVFAHDRAFLRNEAYPAMKEAAQFALTDMVEAPPGTPFAGHLVTNPSTSPENRYLLNGTPHSLTYAPTMDIELIRELFENCRHAAEILGTDAAFQSDLQRAERRLPPLQIGKRGQLQEWIEDYPETEPNHRHVSHLYSLYPGHDISLDGTPDLAAAAKKSLELRGDGGTGWSTVWRVALWARLKNSEHAYNNLKILMTNSTLPDMLDLCPPFQIDGNLGGPAAITEMLVQSTPGAATILPALPPQWPDGKLSGVRLRGGAKADLTWQGGQLTLLTLQAEHVLTYQITYGQHSANVRVGPRQTIAMDGNLRTTAFNRAH
jgi:alpha-L-fucosidase 2